MSELERRIRDALRAWSRRGSASPDAWTRLTERRARRTSRSRVQRLAPYAGAAMVVVAVVVAAVAAGTRPWVGDAAKTIGAQPPVATVPATPVTDGSAPSTATGPAGGRSGRFGGRCVGTDCPAAADPAAAAGRVPSGEVRVAVLGDARDVGPVSVQWTPNDTPKRRTLSVYQQYLNTRFDLHGRVLRLYVVSGDATASGSPRAAVQKADEEYHVFAVADVSGAAEDEAVRRHVVSIGTGAHAGEWYRSSRPYAWSTVSADAPLELISSLVCAQMAGRPVTWTADANPATTLQGRDRVFGVVEWRDQPTDESARDIDTRLRACGSSVRSVVTVNVGESSADMATGVATMQAAGVTSVIFANAGIAGPAMTKAATVRSYFPEWVAAGTSGDDTNAGGRQFDQRQWAAMVGMSTHGPIVPAWRRAEWCAYKTIDPDGEPSADADFSILQLIAGGLAGTPGDLSPLSFEAGMFRQWPPQRAEHRWEAGGGFMSGDWTWTDYAWLQYWDARGDGAYRFLHDGMSFTYDEMPDTSPWHEASGTLTELYDGSDATC